MMRLLSGVDETPALRFVADARRALRKVEAMRVPAISMGAAVELASGRPAGSRLSLAAEAGTPLAVPSAACINLPQLR